MAARFPSVDLVNDYLVVDEDGKAKEWDQTSYYKKFLVDGGTVEDAIYKNRDKRFKASIVYDGCSYFANRVWLREEVIFIILLKRQNSGNAGIRICLSEMRL